MRELSCGRPRGEIRLAIAEAARELQAKQGGATCRELAQASCVGYRAAKQTVANMVRSGELKAIGKRVVPGAPRGLLVFAPAYVGDQPGVGAELQAVVVGWLRPSDEEGAN